MSVLINFIVSLNFILLIISGSYVFRENKFNICFVLLFNVLWCKIVYIFVIGISCF